MDYFKTAREWRMFRNLYTKEEHTRRAQFTRVDADSVMRHYDDLVNDALTTFGPPEGWPMRWVSGVINDAWPNAVKDRIRATLRSAYDLRDTAQAHYKASGRRKRLAFHVGQFYK